MLMYTQYYAAYELCVFLETIERIELNWLDSTNIMVSRPEKNSA